MENVTYLRYVRQQLLDLPVCIEFRHQSWFDAVHKEQTLQFLVDHQFIHAVCDEPQVKMGSIQWLIVLLMISPLYVIMGATLKAGLKRI